MKSQKFLISILIFCILLCLTGCRENDEDEDGVSPVPPDLPDTSADSVHIINFSPDSVSPDVDTTFDVKISYKLVTKDSGEILMGFNNVLFAGVDSNITHKWMKVSKGSGSVTFSTNTKLINWGKYGDSKCMIGLFEDPIPKTLDPLAGDSVVIQVSDPPYYE